MTPNVPQSSGRIRPPFNRHVLAVDGHDGSGKTTLARALAMELGAVYVRPFGGLSGTKFLEAAERGRPADAIAIAQAAIADTMACVGSAEIVVFDRCWMTVFSAIPHGYFDQWQNRIPTLLCWSDLDRTLERLQQRSEPRLSVGWHRYYINRYADLARQFECTVVRTDELDEHQALRCAHIWARTVIDSQSVVQRRP